MKKSPETNRKTFKKCIQAPSECETPERANGVLTKASVFSHSGGPESSFIFFSSFRILEKCYRSMKTIITVFVDLLIPILKLLGNIFNESL